MKKESRRDFLKIAGLSAFALGTATFFASGTNAAAPGTAAAAQAGAKTGVVPANGPTVAGAKPAVAGVGSYAVEPGALQAKRWAMVIDTRKFTRPEHFQRVIDACHETHNVPTIPGKQDVKWLWTDKFAQVFPDDPLPYAPERILHGEFLLLCNHCENPPCVRVCPTGATFLNEEGVVVMDPHRCIGCRFCMAGCPYGSRSFNFRDPQAFVKTPNPDYPLRTRGVVEKCTFCPERLSVGKLPACVEASEGAMIFGDLNDPNSPVRRALSQNFAIRRKPTLGTQPGVYYII